MPGEAVLTIRHAEKEASGEDPSLADEGRARAAAWPEMLSKAGIEHVITTDSRRTQETGSIFAELVGLGQTRIAMADVAGLVDALEFDHADERVLVVARAETIPSILSGLGFPEKIEVSQDDYANLFLDLPMSDGRPELMRLVMP